MSLSKKLEESLYITYENIRILYLSKYKKSIDLS